LRTYSMCVLALDQLLTGSSGGGGGGGGGGSANNAVWSLWKEEINYNDPRTLEQYLLDKGVSDEGRALIEAGYSNTLCSTSDRLPLYGTLTLALRAPPPPLLSCSRCSPPSSQGVVRLEQAWSGDGGGDYRLDDSMAAVINNMASKVNGGVRVGWPVVSVDYSRPGVVTLTNEKGETLQASSVVSTVPVAVLKRGALLSLSLCVSYRCDTSRVGCSRYSTEQALLAVLVCDALSLSLSRAMQAISRSTRHCLDRTRTLSIRLVRDYNKLSLLHSSCHDRRSLANSLTPRNNLTSLHHDRHVFVCQDLSRILAPLLARGVARSTCAASEPLACLLGCLPAC